MCFGGEAASSTAAEGPQPHFDIHEYRVLGNTVLPVREVERALYPSLGDRKEISDVQAARAALEKLYHDRGYGTVFVDVPPQDVGDGVVRLRVTEGRLRERTVTGARYFSERDVATALTAATPGTVPNLQQLQQQLAALNSQTADRSVVPVLKAGPVPGTMDLQLRVQDKIPLHGSLQLDNDYTVDTEPLRATAALSYANLFSELDTVSLQYQDAPQAPGEVGVLNASYESRPLWGDARLAMSFINSNSNVSTVGGGALGVLGKGQIYSTRLTWPVLATPESQQSLALGFDYKHFRDSVTLGGGSELITPVSYTNASVAYVGAWNLKPADGVLSVTANFGPREAPNNAVDFENNRFLARPDYFYVRGDGTVTAHLPAGFRFTVRIAGQWTAEPLLSYEQLAVGGADGVRGYLAAEELGDTGVKGTVQLQTPTWSWGRPQLLNAFVYYDDGHTRIFDVLPGEMESATLRSWGGGLNVLPGHPFYGIATWADPLTRGSYTLPHQSRVLFLVRGVF